MMMSMKKNSSNLYFVIIIRLLWIFESREKKSLNAVCEQENKLMVIEIVSVHQRHNRYDLHLSSCHFLLSLACTAVDENVERRVFRMLLMVYVTD